jgi:hypothetical protein
MTIFHGQDNGIMIPAHQEPPGKIPPARALSRIQNMPPAAVRAGLVPLIDIALLKVIDGEMKDRGGLPVRVLQGTLR